MAVRQHGRRLGPGTGVLTHHRHRDILLRRPHVRFNVLQAVIFADARPFQGCVRRPAGSQSLVPGADEAAGGGEHGEQADDAGHQHGEEEHVAQSLDFYLSCVVKSSVV